MFVKSGDLIRFCARARTVGTTGVSEGRRLVPEELLRLDAAELGSSSSGGQCHRRRCWGRGGRNVITCGTIRRPGEFLCHTWDNHLCAGKHNRDASVRVDAHRPVLLHLTLG